MSEVKCPYCQAEQEINHDDGYGYDEGERHEQECVNCEREFEFTTHITFSYSVYCSDEEHDMYECEGVSDLYKCSKCDRYDISFTKN